MDEEYENENNNLAVTLTAIGLAASAVAGVRYIKVVRAERAKRKQIKAWEQDRVATIRASRDKLMAMMADPNVSLSEVLAAWRREQEFLDIVCHPSTQDLT